ncbi:E3 ubiquitin-protein ligase rnf213-alpha-like protein, partial [Lates japonicus]
MCAENKNQTWMLLLFLSARQKKKSAQRTLSLKMKCSQCGHNILEKTAKFCSECGRKLSVQPADTHDADSQPKSLVADLKGTTEELVPEKSAPPVDNKESNKSPKRPNEEVVDNPKKK